MVKKLKNITKFTLSAALAFSLLTLNLSSVLHCSSMANEESCCHITNKIKSCCVKHFKVTSDPRITKHCGCDMSESQQTADLYLDLKNSGQNTASKNYTYSTDDVTLVSSVTGNTITNEYSPPPRNKAGTFILVRSLRI